VNEQKTNENQRHHHSQRSSYAGALNALIRAAAEARKIAIQTNTHLIIFKDGKIQRISPEELRLQAETKDDSTSLE
jgi:hypothetical protein